MSATRALAEFALGVDAEATPEAVRHEALRILVDCVGCAVAGVVTPAGRIALEMARDERGPLTARLVGGGRASLMPAAFATTVLCNALDYEPVGPEGHVCAVAVPVALAVADAVDAPGSELLAGLLAGLEAGGRVGGALRRVGQSGAKVTPAVRGTAHAVFAAVAAAGRILRLTPAQMHEAFGIAGYSATLPTLKKVMSSEHAPMTKYDHLGLIAQNGIQAALLARKGFTGDRSVLEGEYGFWRFAGALGYDEDFVTRDLGATWTIGQTWFKRYPVILYTTPVLDTVRRLMAESGLVADAIERVEVATTRPNAVQAVSEVRDEMDAWTSTPYNVAVAAHDVRPRRAWQQPATYRRPDLVRLTRAVTVRALRADELPPAGNYWEGWCPVRVTVHSGQAHEGAQDRLPRIEDDEIDKKFRDNVVGLLSDDAAERLRTACWRAAGIGSAREITELIGTATAPARAG
ncbi:MAG: MmgE/PrpD family protein [Chloroflexota bacterium]|nr:MmgE/PrpD family protein [Chloroflexota bacterium]MDE3192598.1 MmgE/PrpD family protein [Chloroflexota bacterium]